MVVVLFRNIEYFLITLLNCMLTLRVKILECTKIINWSLVLVTELSSMEKDERDVSSSLH